MSAPQKFSFDNDFFDITVAGKSASAPYPGTTGAKKLDEQLANAKEEGYAQGLTEGRTQATQAAMAEVAELKNHLFTLTQKLSEAQTEWQSELQKQALSLLRITLHHLVGHAASNYPDQLLELYLKDLLPLLRTGEELHLRLHPQARSYHEKLGLPQASIGGRAFQIVPDNSLGPADVVVEWSQGGLEARLPDILNRIDQLLLSCGAQNLPTPEAPQATGFTPSTPQPAATSSPDNANAPAEEEPDDLARLEQETEARKKALLDDEES